MLCFRNIRPSCVGATPVPKGFHHMSNFQFQFPLYKQGHAASLQRSYGLGWDQGWSPWRTCSLSRCSFTIQAFWWLSGYCFVICMNNSRNRSPLRIFQYLPISATFVQCGQRRPSWTMHVNSINSSGTLSGMKRLRKEIRSFKCVVAPARILERSKCKRRSC